MKFGLVDLYFETCMESRPGSGLDFGYLNLITVPALSTNRSVVILYSIKIGKLGKLTLNSPKSPCFDWGLSQIQGKLGRVTSYWQVVCILNYLICWSDFKQLLFIFNWLCMRFGVSDLKIMNVQKFFHNTIHPFPVYCFCNEKYMVLSSQLAFH